MLDIFVAQCANDAAYFEPTSLNETVAVDGGSDGEICEIVDLIADPLADFEADILEAESTGLVWSFMENLNPTLRCIALRRYYLDQSHLEIAGELGVTRSAISHALRRIHRLGRMALAPALN
jgi:DNA-directed RNA polymerase specialized sigma24 family protein